jgi:RNA polymerase sigma-70 factor (ECF subfamily)
VRPSEPDQSLADIALLERVTTRDQQALAELYDRHSRLLFTLIVRIVRDRAEAEEVLQEVFLAVWTKAAT